MRDLRKDEPYLAYPDLDFQVICSDGGDCYARYLVRMREMAESLKIIEQAIENIPGGPVNVESVTDVVLPAKPAVYRSIEGLIQHFEVLMPNRGFDVPREEIYAATESPNGELGFYIVADGNAAGVSSADAAAVVHSLRHVSAHDSRLSIERRGGGAGKHQHHCGGVGSVERRKLTTKARRTRRTIQDIQFLSSCIFVSFVVRNIELHASIDVKKFESGFGLSSRSIRTSGR